MKWIKNSCSLNNQWKKFGLRTILINDSNIGFNDLLQSTVSAKLPLK